jgi:tetratricopeptide (TPR) repeat protein/TolB-like protein
MHCRVFVAACVVAIAVPARAQAPPPRILVMPFENVARDSRIFWLTEGAAVLVADNLNALGAGAITREERRAAFERLQVPPAAALTDATVIRIGELVGASHVVVGTLQFEGSTLLVRAKSIALEAARIQSSVTEGGPLTDLFVLFERVSRGVAPPSSRPAPGPGPEQPPVGAFENYIKGLLAETPATAVRYLDAALRLYPQFSRARLALWDVYTEQGDHTRALASVRPVTANSQYGRRARFLAGLSLLSLNRHDEAFATYKELLDESPTAAVFNNLGVVQLRRGSTAQTGEPAYYFNKAGEADGNESDYFFNLGYAYWLNRDTQAAIYWLREALRRDPADADAHFVLGAALAAAGSSAEANRERELASRLSESYEELAKKPGGDTVPKGLERIRSDIELPHAARVEETLAATGQRDQKELARFYLDRGQRLFEQERDREALGEVNRALFLSPYEPQAHLLVARIHLRGGRIDEAIEALKISLWSEETADAHAALAAAWLEANDPASARAEAERALALDPASDAAKRVLDRAQVPRP